MSPFDLDFRKWRLSSRIGSSRHWIKDVKWGGDMPSDGSTGSKEELKVESKEDMVEEGGGMLGQ